MNQIQVDSKLRGTGKIVVCVSGSAPLAEKFVETAKDLKDRSNLLLAIPQDLGELRAVTSELAALRWVWENTAELRDDRAARRELALRIADAERLLRSTLHRLLDPRPDPLGSRCVWYYCGRLESVETPADVSRLLSKVCDRLFSASPLIRNELIVRTTLSSAAAAARRNLVEAMLTRAGEPALGIQGFPPERSMYESALRATGIHVREAAGGWTFVPPPKNHETRLWPAWEHLNDQIFQPHPGPQPLDVVFRSMAAPPLGVMDGLQPVILCAFMQIHTDEVTLYREGTFLPDPSVADFELLMRRPELFAIAGSRVQGPRADVVTRLAKRLGVRPATVPVVRALFKMVRSLPEFAWRTNRLPETVRALRLVFDNAKSPERFLFIELPQALHQPAFEERRTDPQQVETFFASLNQNLQALNNASPGSIAAARDQLLRACGFAAGAEHWQELREAALRLEPLTTHTNLLAFLRRLTQSQNDPAGIASVLALVANCPPASWSDHDAERFPELAQAMGTMFLEARTGLEEAAVTTIFRGLTPPQRRKADQLHQEIRRLLSAQAMDDDPIVVRAALLALAEELNNRNRPD